MPYHIKTPGKLAGDVYWKGDNTWTVTYNDRKQYANKSDADAQAATTQTETLGNRNITYTPTWWENSTVVTE